MKIDKDKKLEEFWPRLARIASAYEMMPHLQQELQQEMALAIWQALDRFRGDSSIETFFYKIAHNVAVGHVKKQVKQVKTSQDTCEVASESSLEQDYSKEQQLDRLMKAIRQLPLIQRQLITLFLDGLKQQDIAEIMGITENNVAVRVNRAKKSLQEIMTKAE
ncbi:RNA polymerase sigma factor [Pleionea sp. CnH1-48]|uniref:RNA polymerase sigma factor n=1 Tax=Pleionea sp. CnH1-48 TaxID=2954494 RepID=UPI00209768C1|nr:RNA polymerase sigma factor [Pleionea sp. CnH1-48]MCO7222674.1 RNA polymerase sigma factor [Pleionea sp. CnH1-48]